MTDDLKLIIGTVELLGWENIRVTCGIERCPNDFELSMTERFPGELDFTVHLGQPCTVMLGADIVITGYVNRYTPSIRANQHSIKVTGRGRCQDLVDCAAEWPGGQISASSALGIAQKLCEPYGIKATCLSDPGPAIPQRMLNLGESAYEIIESVCRFAALLPYEGADGNLVLSRVGPNKAASGFQEGVNVEDASLVYSDDQQFSEILVVRMAMDVVQDMGDGGNIVAIVKNPNIRRHRRHIVVAETGDAGAKIAEQRALWECTRRYGRSAALSITTDSWRDIAGQLYAPNSLVEINIPSLKAVKKNWLISEVTYLRDGSGTHSLLKIMPPEAFVPQPVLLQPAHADIPWLER